MESVSYSRARVTNALINNVHVKVLAFYIGSGGSQKKQGLE